MAITITQKPTSPNAAYTRLVYVISGSSNTTAPQFEYVMDVYESGSTNLISRVTQTVNPAGVSVFDPSRIIQDQLEYNSNWKITNTVSGLSNSKKFALKFGELYGTSISSSVTVYPNVTDNVITTFTGVVDPTQGSYNFPSQSYDSKTALTTFNWYTGSSFDNTQLDKFRVVDYEVDYETISVLGVGSTISNVSYRTYDITGSLMDTNSVSGFGLSMYDIFAGPKNFIDKGSVFQTQFEDAWFYYSIAITLGDSSVKYYWYKRSISESNEKVRFAFINKLGVWDYYNNYNPVRRSSDIQRENVTLPRVDYSSTLSPYNINRRGEKSYFIDTKDRFTVDTPLLDKTKANWLEQLLESPSVFIQRGSDFVPVVITNNSYRHNNDSARNKLFQYTIEFEPANQPYGDWIPEYANKYCPTPTPSPSPSPTPTPSITPSNTPTATPTSTPTPSSTPTPTPTPSQLSCELEPITTEEYNC